jgi:hypothetical protein
MADCVITDGNLADTTLTDTMVDRQNEITADIDHSRYE